MKPETGSHVTFSTNHVIRRKGTTFTQSPPEFSGSERKRLCSSVTKVQGWHKTFTLVLKKNVYTECTKSSWVIGVSEVYEVYSGVHILKLSDELSFYWWWEKNIVLKTLQFSVSYPLCGSSGRPWAPSILAVFGLGPFTRRPLPYHHSPYNTDTVLCWIHAVAFLQYFTHSYFILSLNTGSHVFIELGITGLFHCSNLTARDVTL